MIEAHVVLSISFNLRFKLKRGAVAAEFQMEQYDRQHCFKSLAPLTKLEFPLIWLSGESESGT